MRLEPVEYRGNLSGLVTEKPVVAKTSGVNWSKGLGDIALGLHVTSLGPVDTMLNQSRKLTVC